MRGAGGRGARDIVGGGRGAWPLPARDPCPALRPRRRQLRRLRDQSLRRGEPRLRTALRRRHVHPAGRHLRPAAGGAARADLQPVLVMRTSWLAAALLVALLAAPAAAGFNRNFLVPSFQSCTGPQTCFPPRHGSSFTFGSAVLKTPVSRFLRSRKTAFILELKGVRDAAANLPAGVRLPSCSPPGQATGPATGPFRRARPPASAMPSW